MAPGSAGDVVVGEKLPEPPNVLDELALRGARARTAAPTDDNC